MGTRYLMEDTNVKIPGTIKTVGKNEFSGCDSIETVVISEGVESIEEFAFWDCRKLNTVTIPNSVYEIGGYAFDKCYALESITIPDNVKVLNGSVFPGSSDIGRSLLKEILVTSNNPVYASVDGVLYTKDMKRLVAYPAGKEETIFKVPETVEVIGIRAFSGCFNLKEVILNDGCKVIEEEAFSYCRYLVCINLAQIKDIQRGAFEYCLSLKEVDLDGLDTIESSCFHGCWGLSQVCLGKVETIKDKAFIDCKALSKVELPDTLSVIEKGAFSGSNIQKMTIPKTVHEVGACCFGGAKCIRFYDNLLGERIEAGKIFSNTDVTEFEMTVLDVNDDSVKFLVPVYCDGTWEMKKMLHKALKEDNTFDFSYFDSYFSMIKDKDKKIKIAVSRLRNPYDLNEASKQNYEDYLKKNRAASIQSFIESKDNESFRVLLDIGMINSRNIKKYIKLAKDKGAKGIRKQLEEYSISLENKIPVKISSEKPEFVKEESQKNFEQIVLKGKTFSVAGFSEIEESQIAKSIECNGGKYLFNFSTGLDYLIYNDNSEKEPIKMKKAKLLSRKGQDISFITIEEYHKMIEED